MAKVFISFIHEETTVATAVQRLIEKKLSGQKPFLSSDEWQIHAGELWLDRIRSELDTAEVVVLLLSPTSVTRPWVNFEAGAAWLASKVIVPVCYGGLTRDTLPKPYSGIQALDLREDGYYLFKSIAHHLKLATPPPMDFNDYQPGSELHRALDALEQGGKLTNHQGT